MALPTSGDWTVADFNSATMALLLGLGPSDLSLNPGAAPYFTYNGDTNLFTAASSDGVAAYADFNVAMPGLYTIDMVVRFPALPRSVTDIAAHHAGIQLADDAGRGVAIYFAQTGIAIARIDDFGSVAPLPDSTEFTAEIARYFHRIRIGVNSAEGRAYVYIGRESDAFPPLRFIIPVEATPVSVGDRFRVVVRGSSAQPVQFEFRTLQVAGQLLLPNLPPIANAGADRVITSGNTVRLDGRASFDPEGAPLSYLWKAVDAPFQSTFAFDGSSGSTTDDGDADGVTTILSFTPNSLPSWVANGDVLLLVGSRHLIDTIDNPAGTLVTQGDTLPDNVEMGPFRIVRQSVLVGPESDTPIAVPDVPGLYRFVLTVNDGEAFSEEAEVLVSVVGARAPLGIEPNVDVLWDALGDEWKLIENRDVFTEFWRGTTQVLGAKLLEAWQHHYNYSLRDAQRVFQKKWVAFPTMLREPLPEFATISPRYGRIEGIYDFDAGDPPVTGATIVLELPEVGGTFTQHIVTLTGDSSAAIMSDINAVSAPLGIEAVVTSEGGTRLSLFSTETSFRIGVASSAASLLELPTEVYNYLAGAHGDRVTPNTYRVEPGVDLVAHGVIPGDLLLLNNGQAFRIDRVLNDSRDPGPNQRLLLRETLPLDASKTWEIPSILKSAETDYEALGVYPGDLVKIETVHASTMVYADCNGYVVGQYGSMVGARLDGLFPYLRGNYDFRWLGVKRRKGVALPADVISIPRLQDLIPVKANPTMWFENTDYILEPYYRDNGEPSPQLQFRDEVFVDPDIEPPDVLWAELVLFNNDANIESLFGRLVGFTREDAKPLGEGFSYLSGVSGLMYAMQRGPSVSAMRIGAQILFGQPFAEVAGVITEIRNDYSPELSRILIQDADGNTPSQSEIIRSYVYRKDPLDLSPTSGLEVNPTTSVPYAVGDSITQFAPIGTGVRIEDFKNSPAWFRPYVSSGMITEMEKFFYFVVRFNLDLVSLANITLIYQYMYRVKPTYTHPLLVGAKNLADDIDVVDSWTAGIRFSLFDSCRGMGQAFMYDDFRGDGTTWSSFDDGVTYFDGLVDCPQDWIQFVLSLTWAGGIPTYDSVFFSDIDVEDTDGVYTGTAGALFTPTYDMSLPAGTYVVAPVIDAGNQVLP